MRTIAEHLIKLLCFILLLCMGSVWAIVFSILWLVCALFKYIPQIIEHFDGVFEMGSGDYDGSQDLPRF